MENPQRIRIINWNILHDNSANKRARHPLQKDRLKEIAQTIHTHILDNQTIVFICEGANKKNMEALNNLLPSVSMAGTTAYPNDYMGIYTNIDGVCYEEIALPKMNISYPKTKAVQIRINGLLVTGIHQPDEIRLAGAVARLRAIKRIRSKECKKHLIIGDFNALWFQTSRLKLRFSGYKRTQSKWPWPNDSFPDPKLKGRAVPRFTPRLPIDAQYYKGVILEKRQSINTGFSDHPIQICDYFLPC